MPAPRKKCLAKTKEQVEISQRAAQRLLGDTEIVSAFDELEDAYMAAWANTTPGDAGLREVAYFGMKAVKDVRAVLLRSARSAQVRDTKERLANG